MRGIRILACALTAALAACGSPFASNPSAPSLASQPSFGNAAAANATIKLGLNSGNKPGLNLTISVGGAPAKNVLLDTGSSGLWIYPNAIGKYRATSHVVTNSYGSGLIYTGILVYSTVDFGNGLTTKDVPLALVQSATCESTHPVCEATPGSSYCPTVKPGKDAGIQCLEVGRKLYGTFGASLATIGVPSNKPVEELYNLVFGIDKPFAHAFTILPGSPPAPPRLIVGPQSLAGFTVLHLKPSPAPKPLPNGAKGWERDVKLCWTVDTVESPLSNYCVDTLFDTGASSVDFEGKVGPHLVSTADCGTRVKPGTNVIVKSLTGKKIELFFAGNLTNFNRVVTDSSKTKDQVNTGLTYFNRDRIYYDASDGVVALQPLPKFGNVAVSGCGSN